MRLLSGADRFKGGGSRFQVHTDFGEFESVAEVLEHIESMAAIAEGLHLGRLLYWPSGKRYMLEKCLDFSNSGYAAIGQCKAYGGNLIVYTEFNAKYVVSDRQPEEYPWGHNDIRYYFNSFEDCYDKIAELRGSPLSAAVQCEIKHKVENSIMHDAWLTPSEEEKVTGMHTIYVSKYRQRPLDWSMLGVYVPPSEA